MGIFNFRSKAEEKPKYKAGRWLARIEDLPEPENEQTDQLKRLLSKLQRITKDLSNWSISYEENKLLTYDTTIAVVLTNKKGHIVKMWNNYLESPEGYYCANKCIEVLIKGVTIEYISIRLSNSIWSSDEKKESKESKIIFNLEEAIDKMVEDEKEKLRSQFYFYGNVNE